MRRGFYRLLNSTLKVWKTICFQDFWLNSFQLLNCVMLKIYRTPQHCRPTCVELSENLPEIMVS